MNASKVNPRTHHEADHPEQAPTWMTEFERVFIVGAAGAGGEEILERRRKYLPAGRRT